MIEFNLENFKDTPFLKAIIASFLDKDFESLTDIGIVNNLKVLDNFIYKYTGLPEVRITNVNLNIDQISYLTHRNNRIAEDTVIVLNFNKKANVNGPRILLAYLKEKYHQYENYSIVYGNFSMKESILREWKYGNEFKKNNNEYYKYKTNLYNPLERDAYTYQLKQLIALSESFITKRTSSKAKKAINKERHSIWNTVLDIEKNKKKTEDIINSMKKIVYVR